MVSFCTKETLVSNGPVFQDDLSGKEPPEATYHTIASWGMMSISHWPDRCTGPQEANTWGRVGQKRFEKFQTWRLEVDEGKEIDSSTSHGMRGRETNQNQRTRLFGKWILLGGGVPLPIIPYSYIEAENFVRYLFFTMSWMCFAIMYVVHFAYEMLKQNLLYFLYCNPPFLSLQEMLSQPRNYWFHFLIETFAMRSQVTPGRIGKSKYPTF